MKIIFKTLVFFLFLSCNHLFAQRLVHYGAHVGVAVSNADSINTYKDSQTRVGYTFGVYARIGYRLFFQPQIDYTIFSTPLTQNYAKGQIIKETLDYGLINIPLLAGYKIFQSSDEKSNFRLMGGVIYSHVTNVKSSSSGYTKDSFNKNLFSVGGGLGFDIKYITIDLKVQFGLNDFSTTAPTRNRMGTLTVGFRL